MRSVVLVSSQFGVKRKPQDDWFDAILTVDTRLFVDPFLIFKEQHGDWSTAHDEFIAYFDRCFKLLARSGNNPQSIWWRKVAGLLRFPEPREFCLGYVAEGTAGAGGGPGFAEKIAQDMADAIKRGVQSLSHFEELGILNEGIGPDRISDILCNVLRPRFIAYTQAVAKRHKLPVQRVRVEGAEFDLERERWQAKDFDLPVNPFTSGPLLLVPQRFLRDLPVLNAAAWWESSETVELRNDLNISLMDRVSKAEIVRIARAHPESVRRWIASQEGEPAEPYDFNRDRQGVWKWAPATSQFIADNPLKIAPAKTDAEFLQVIENVLGQYILYIEEQGGWKLLWNDDHTQKPEEAAQLTFLGIARGYCAANNIVLDREVDLGRGPVDFKFSNGYTQRALLEMKKLHNGKFWNGLEKQLPSYMASDAVAISWFVAIQYVEAGVSEKRALKLRNSKPMIQAGPPRREIRFTVIDGTPKLSASKL